MSELYDMIVERRKKLDLENPDLITHVKESELDKSRGTTEKMRSYCRKQGLNGIKDINNIWRKKNHSHIFKVK